MRGVAGDEDAVGAVAVGDQFTPPPSGLVDEDTGETVEPQPVPEWDEASRVAVVDAAEAAMTAFARPDLDYDTWWAGVEPLLTPEAAEDYAYVQHLSGGRVDLMLGRGSVADPGLALAVRQALAQEVDRLQFAVNEIDAVSPQTGEDEELVAACRIAQIHDHIASLPEERSREIEVLEFVPASDLDPLMYDRSYFLEPDGKSSKSYVLLAKTLAETDRVAIVNFALRNKTRLAALRVKDFSKRDVMMIHTLLWPDEIRSADFASVEDQELSDKEMSMARMLIDELAGDYDPDEFEDDYALAVEALVRAKIDGGQVQQVEDDEEESGEVVDLLAALARSVEKAKAARGESSPAPAKATAKKATAKKATAKKATAKKATAKKTAATKSTAKKTSAKKTAPKKKAS